MARPRLLARVAALVALAAPAAAQAHHDEHAGGEAASHAGTQVETPSSGARARLLSVSRIEGKDGPRWTVLCDDAPFDELVRALAKKSGLALEGSELLPLGPRVSVELERRPLEQVLAIVLGMQGLRHELARGSLHLFPASNEPSELLRLAQEAWLRVEAGGTAEGDESAAARAKLAQGNLCEARGDLEGAYRHYAELAEGLEGEESAEATYRAGRVLERLGHWAEAAQHFRTLGGLESAKRFHAKARLELARVSIELGDAKSALHVLNFLEANYATSDPAELAERRLVRARALNATHEYVEALRTLEEGELVAAPESEARSLEIRAVAFEGLGYEVEAARAWLIYAREAAAPETRTGAFARAANLSLAAGDELGTLFICREAARAGSDEGLGASVRVARQRLGLDEDEVPTTILERLELAERHLAAAEPAKAAPLFESLYLARGALPEVDQARVLAGWSRVVLERAGLESAVAVLSKARAALADETALQTLDLAAAALFEAEGRFDEAAAAYQGEY
jgi:hypothetical protein